MTVKAECPVSAWSPVSSSLKAFAHWLSLEGGDLWTEICVLPSPHPTRFGCFPFCPSCLFFGFWATNNRPHFYNSSLAPTVGLLHLHDIWLSGGFPSSDSSHHNLPRRLQGAHCSWLAGSETGIWGDVSSSYQNNLFQRSSLFLPCSTLGANLHFYLVEQKRASGWAEELQDSMPTSVHQGEVLFWTQSAIWAFCQLVMTFVCCWGPSVLGKCLYGTPYQSTSQRICDSSSGVWTLCSICVTSIFVVFCKIGNSGSIH